MVVLIENKQMVLKNIIIITFFYMMISGHYFIGSIVPMAAQILY